MGELFGKVYQSISSADGKGAATARILIIVFAIVGIIVFSALKPLGVALLEEIHANHAAIDRMNSFIAGAEETRKTRDSQVADIAKRNDGQDTKIDDHERRLGRLESLPSRVDKLETDVLNSRSRLDNLNDRMRH